MWTLEQEDDYVRRHKRFEKKRPRELKATLGNLAKFLASLNAGARAFQIKAGFVHHEPDGVIAISQQGGGGNLAETRLYTFPNGQTETLHLITLGDKSTQQADIRFCSEFVGSIHKHQQQQTFTNDQQEDIQQRS